MPLRDDHDAALARADALQVELDRERNAHTQQGDRIEGLERELREARLRLERAEETLGDLKPRKSIEADNPRVDPPPESNGGARAGYMLGGGLLVVAMIIALAWCANRSGSESQPAEPAPPTGPFVPDRLNEEGFARISADLKLNKLEVDYVQTDGTLDATHGRIRIETRKPKPPKPADDPNRPTGAPEPGDPMLGMMMDNCPSQYWSPRSGWAEQRDSCLSFGDEPVGQPRCTVAAILEHARVDGAPSGLARVNVEWTYMIDGSVVRGWKWSFSITDDARDISFRREYDDRSCSIAVER